jgi:hypothetical protein
MWEKLSTIGTPRDHTVQQFLKSHFAMWRRHSANHNGLYVTGGCGVELIYNGQ